MTVGSKAWKSAAGFSPRAWEPHDGHTAPFRTALHVLRLSLTVTHIFHCILLYMFSRAKPERGAGEASEPLLQRDEADEHEDNVLFSVADDGEESESGSVGEDIARTPNTGVRFQERVDVRIYAPEWSQQSREAGELPYACRLYLASYAFYFFRVRARPGRAG